VTACSDMQGRLPSLDGGPGGARSAPPAIDQGIVENDSVGQCVAVDEDAGAAVLVRAIAIPTSTVPAGRPNVFIEVPRLLYSYAAATTQFFP